MNSSHTPTTVGQLVISSIVSAIVQTALAAGLTEDKMDES